MEINEAIKESDDRRLKTKYNNAVYIIQRALALYSVDELALSFNGGKDSTVLLHLLRAGCYLHAVGKNDRSNLDSGEAGNKFPVRTIYFENPTVFPEINSFTYDTASAYKLQMDIIRLDFKSGLEALLKANPIRAIFLGVRIGDPTAVGQEQFSPSSPGWPPFMRVNPILDWSYRDVWAFLLACKVFAYGGVGPLPSDVTIAGVAKAFGVRMAPDEEFEEYLRHLIGEKCTGHRNEMAHLPEGITELLHHEKLNVPLIKCQNVIILTATNVAELDQEWDCLIELIRFNEQMSEPFVSKKLAASNLSDVEASQPLSEIRFEFPDIFIGCYRESRQGPLIITFDGKDIKRINAAVEALGRKFHPGVFSEVDQST
ncbi:phosphoadenosine phosphosulfate (PAPS) reductase family protein [Striga hermonthica]|uniref:FAD synthase n=1 Tax=Striga hermonthica TaxID=68872 RepID=A0A9N7NIB2_STRHE|nr:phosphoadenosine phosphosulfate (PAPS) reductase family protein [Striga hermonthica]